MLHPAKEALFYDHIANFVKNDVTLMDDIFHIEEPYLKISVYEEAGVGRISTPTGKKNSGSGPQLSPPDSPGWI